MAHIDDRDPELVDEARQAYTGRRARRRDRLAGRAARLQAEGEAQAGAAREVLSLRPFGQPLHSARQVRQVETQVNRLRAGHAKMDRAAELQARAARVGTGGIASDDPDAVAQLRVKLDTETRFRDTAKAIRRRFKKITGDSHPRLSVLTDEQVAACWSALIEAGASEAVADKVMASPDWEGRIGYPDHTVRNATANIRRIETRIAELEVHDVTEAIGYEGPGWAIYLDDGRVCCELDRRYEWATRRRVFRGWTWARSRQRWQRTDTPQARAEAEALARRLPDLIAEKEPL